MKSGCYANLTTKVRQKAGFQFGEQLASAMVERSIILLGRNIMASQLPPDHGTFRFEFDTVNKILLLRFEGPLTDESLSEIHRTARIHWAATGARAGIGDYSSVTEFPLSAELVRTLARQGAPMPEPTEHPHFIVMPSTTGYGLARMYQIARFWAWSVAS